MQLIQTFRVVKAFKQISNCFSRKRSFLNICVEDLSLLYSIEHIRKYKSYWILPSIILQHIYACHELLIEPSNCHFHTVKPPDCEFCVVVIESNFLSKNDFQTFSALGWTIFQNVRFLMLSALRWDFWRYQMLKKCVWVRTLYLISNIKWAYWVKFGFIFVYKMNLISETCIASSI